MAATQAVTIPAIGANSGYDPSAGSRSVSFSSEDQENQPPNDQNGLTPPMRSSNKRRRPSVAKCETFIGGPPSSKTSKRMPEASDGNAHSSGLILFENPEDGSRRLGNSRGASSSSHRNVDKRPGTEAEREDKETMMMDWKSKFTPGEIVIIPRSENRLHYGTVVAIDEKLVSVDLGNNMVKRMPTLLVGKLSDSSNGHNNDIMSKAKTVMHTVEAISHYLLTSAKLKKPIDDNVRNHCVFVLTYQARRLFALLTKQEHQYSTRVAHENHSIDALVRVRQDLSSITGTIDRFLSREQHSSQGSAQ
ncbi:hypothetical protein FOL47_003777 [Perkinsus chesapeaki]|uniref:Uncharacterized protein n=1 Tax=Perkinsus chesapeaki TaxID=330153 RepID=A0A7J6N078_PERCH|nr:hypothetical protein FOL47_003777 [Perkinsus chesapeaki]